MYDKKRNMAIDVYYTNLQNILNFSKEMFRKWRMDLLIYNFVGNVVIHYWRRGNASEFRV